MYDFIIIAIVVLILAYTGGKMARNRGRPFWIGALIALSLNIIGLILIIYMGRNTNKISDFKFRKNSDNDIAELKHLTNMHQEGKISDQKFKRLKSDIIGTIPS